jgi:O-antigen ligase
MTTLRNTAAPEAVRRIGGVAAAAGASVVAGYTVAVRPATALMLAAGATFAALVVASVDMILVVFLLGRNLADAVASTTIAAGLNAGALVGVLVVAVGALRMLALSRPRALVLGLLLAFLLLFWAGVAWSNAGFDPAVTRELVRSISVVVLALIVLNAPDVRAVERVPAIVVATILVPAMFALGQFATGSGFAGTTRVYGTLSHPNTAGALFAVGLSVALWKYVADGRSTPYAAAAVVLAVATLATQSMAAVGQAVVTLFVFGWLAYRRTVKMLVLSIAAAALAIGFVFSPLGQGRIAELERTQSVESLTAAADRTAIPANSLEWRLGHWANELDLWQEKPALGWGLASSSSFKKVDGFEAHSDPIRLIVETGIVGVLVFGAAMVFLVARLWRAAKESSRPAPLPLAMIAIFSGLATNALVNHVSEQTAITYALAVLVGCALWSEERA